MVREEREKEIIMANIEAVGATSTAGVLAQSNPDNQMSYSEALATYRKAFIHGEALHLLHTLKNHQHPFTKAAES